MNILPFPASLAKQAHFCNREEEREQLVKHIKQNMHTVVIAPRRYGKTSLINQVLFENTYPFAHIDLFLAADEQFVKKVLQDNLAKLLQSILPRKTQAKQAMIEWLRKLHPKLTLSSFGQSLEISTTQTAERSTVD